MALVSSTLQASLEAALLKAKASTTPDATSVLAADIAMAIDIFVKTATVTTPINTVVSTTGTPTAQAGTGTGVGIGVVT